MTRTAKVVFPFVMTLVLSLSGCGYFFKTGAGAGAPTSCPMPINIPTCDSCLLAYSAKGSTVRGIMTSMPHAPYTQAYVVTNPNTNPAAYAVGGMPVLCQHFQSALPALPAKPSAAEMRLYYPGSIGGTSVYDAVGLNLQ